jgi:hypothetical protein
MAEPVDDEKAYGKSLISELMGRAMLERSDFGKLLKYLTQADGLPGVEYKAMPPDYHGQFSYDTAVPRDPGLVEVSNNSVNTLVHEFTHAGQKQMREQAARQGAGKQFVDGYNKLMGAGDSGPAGLVNKIAPAWQSAGSKYRTTPNEAQAHAMGNMSPLPHPSMAAPAHVDPTLATEFMILLDLATRDLKKPGGNK